MLGDYFDSFINKQVRTGKFSSASEVVRTALRMFEHSEIKKTELINELKKGENSGFMKHFDRQSCLEDCISDMQPIMKYKISKATLKDLENV